MNEEKENQIEVGMNEYVLFNREETERQLRKAFLAGVQLGIDLSRKIYRPEKQEEKLSPSERLKRIVEEEKRLGDESATVVYITQNE